MVELRQLAARRLRNSAHSIKTDDLPRRRHLRDALRRTLVGLPLTLALAIDGRSAENIKKVDPESSPVSDAVSYSSIDPQLGEHLYPNEMRIADELSIVIEDAIRKQYRPGSARRDAHPKAHGCVRAEVHVL